MDPEEIANRSVSNSTVELEEESYRRGANFYERLFLEVYTIATLLSFISCCILIFTILKYEKLRKQTTNMILLNMTILHSIYLFTSPLLFRLFIDFDIIYTISLDLSCILNTVEIVLLLLIVLVIFLIISDWYLKTYHERKYHKFTIVYKFFLILIYFCGLLFCSVTLHKCISYYLTFLTMLILVFAYLALFIVVIVMNIVHKFKSRRLINPQPNIGLCIANISILLWLPTLIAALLSILGIHNPTVFILVTIIGFTSPLFNIIYLYMADNQFNIFIKRVITCRCNVYDNMQDQAVVFTETNGVQITQN